MDTVAFINASTSDRGDLILSFAIDDARWAGGIRSLILLRCPFTDAIFDEDERGITVSMEGHRESRNDLSGRLLTELELDSSTNTARLKTLTSRFEISLRKLGPKDLSTIREYLTKMNYDGRTKIAWK